MKKYKSVPERVIVLAIDSVDYDEDRAIHILDIMVAEEAIRPLNSSSSHRYLISHIQSQWTLMKLMSWLTFLNYSSRSDDRKDSPPITEAIKLTASPIKKIIKNMDNEKAKRSKNKVETPKYESSIIS